MIVLNATNQSVEILMSGAPATTNPSYTSAYADNDGSTFVESESNGALNGTSAVTVVAAPGASTRRTIKEITVYNEDAATVTITVRLNANGTYRNLWKKAIPVGGTWMLTKAGAEATGAAGSSGTSGTSGSSSTVAGSAGTSGTSGTSSTAAGPSGSHGTSGTSGSSGSSSTSGTSGSTGSAGTSGTSGSSGTSSVLGTAATFSFLKISGNYGTAGTDGLVVNIYFGTAATMGTAGVADGSLYLQYTA